MATVILATPECYSIRERSKKKPGKELLVNSEQPCVSWHEGLKFLGGLVTY